MNERVLDHGHVTLVDHMGNDLSIVRAARVLPDADWRGEADEKLLRYMLKHGHSTPFEHVVFTFDVKAPIFVFRQWMRHRTWRCDEHDHDHDGTFWSFNEISARYQELPDEFYVPKPIDIGTQSSSNKQGRWMGNSTEVIARRASEIDDYRNACIHSMHIYRDLLNAGWPRELARCVLPVATYSRMTATVNLWNLFRFLTLRLDDHAQYEIRVYAEAMLTQLEDVVPVTKRLWLEHCNA